MWRQSINATSLCTNSLSLYDTDPLGEVKLPCPVQAAGGANLSMRALSELTQCSLCLSTAMILTPWER
jgi:hypothetical protein